MRCECEWDSRDNVNDPDLYLPQERKAMYHAPGECPGDYNLQKYLRDGKEVMLCSCCNISSDIRVEVGV
jgi:hypothetical protein